MLKLKCVTPPEMEPVDLELIKAQLKIEVDDDGYDDILIPLLPSARDWCERHQNRSYINQIFELALDHWPKGDVIRLPRPMLQAIESVRFITSDGVSHLWDEQNYILDDYSEPGKLVKVHGVYWPAQKLRASNGVIIRYVAGYGNTPFEVPDGVKQAIIMLTIYWFENGICEPPAAVKSLLSQDRVVPI